MTAVLLVAPVPVARQRSGPGIRYWEFARLLSREHAVSLLVPNDDHPTHPDFAVCTAAGAGLDDLLAEHQVVVVQGPALQRHPRLADGAHYLVVDLYDPITLEQLAVDPGGQRGRWLHLEYWALLNEQLRLGDFFICASERQRDYWLGALAAQGRINHATHDEADPQLRRLIDVVPFGLPAEPPRADGPVLKGHLPGLAAGDRLIVWGGGLWEWLDPLTPIRAMARLSERQRQARLVFFESARYESTMTARARRLAAGLDLLGRTVLFAEWLPPERWGPCLLEADVGLSCHPDTVETRFAFRTRLLDYIWAGLPIVTAGGDDLGRQVADHDLGYVVEPGDEAGLARALDALLDEPQARRKRQAAFRQLAEHLTWERVCRPLLAYCRQPWRAGDAQAGFVERWRTAQSDRLLSDLAHARRRCAELEHQVHELAGERDQAREQVGRLEAELDGAQRRLAVAMDGRVMRLMTGTQRALRRLRGGQR